jgi:hypothetical protein
LNPANSLFIYLLEWSLLLTRTSNLLQIKTSLQCNQRNSLRNLRNLLLNLRNLLLNLRNLQFLLCNRCHLLSNNNLLWISNPSLDLVGYNIKLTNTIYDLVRISITRSSTQASSEDEENFVAKQKLW